MQACTLAGSGATLGATTIVLSTMLDINGVQLTLADFGQKGYATLEPSNGSQEEQISFTTVTANANGTTTLGGVKTVLFKTPFTESSGLAKSHPGGSKLIITNTAAFYTQFAVLTGTQTFTGLVTFTQSPVGINPGGDADASTTVKGITKMSVAPASATEPIAVGDNDTRVPTVAQVSYIPTTTQKDALAGSLGTPSSTNTFVTSQQVTTVTAMGAQAVDGTAGSIFTRTLGTNETFTQSGFTVGRVFMVEVKQGSGTSYTVTWFAGVTWITTGATAPVQTTTTNGISTYGFRCTGTDTFLGYLVSTQ